MEKIVHGESTGPAGGANRLRTSLRWYERIQTRIVALFLALLLLVQAISFSLIRHSIDSNALASIDEQLSVGERVFDTVLTQRARNLADETLLLASDYGLRAAVASDDKDTIVSALANHGQRIGARVAFLTDRDFRIKAATRPDAEGFSKRLQLSANTLQGSEPHPIVVLDGRPFLLVQAPVKAPLLLGWVAMAFPIDRELLDEARKVLSLEAVLVRQSGATSWQVLETTRLMREATSDLEKRLNAAPGAVQHAFSMRGYDEEYTGHFVQLARDGDQLVGVLLLRSVTEAVAPYRNLQITLLILTITGVIAFGVGSVMTARRIAGPIQELSKAASELARGDYATPVTGGGRDEIGGLAYALEEMRQAIGGREQKILRLAYWDPLTNLPNRAQFVERVKEATDGDGKQVGVCAVLMLDLDRFKQVNEILGQPFGDRLLQRVALRLSGECLDRGDLLARLGGDEFAMLVLGADEAAAEAKARRVLHAFELAFAVGDQNVDIGAGIGFALFPEDGDDANDLLKHAEVAMYAAKRKKSGPIRYSSALDSTSEASLTLMSDLRRAVIHDELRLFLQPKARLHDGSIVGFEALLRWQHPQRGLLAPIEFIPFAEQTGFIRSISAWVLERGIAWLAQRAATASGLCLSVNLSTRDLLDPDLSAHIDALLRRYAVAAQRLCLEITESSIMDDARRSQATLQQLHDLGVQLSIDDFGTGYSSLAYLKQLNVDELKIDRSFVLAMEGDAGNAKIVRSTIDLGHNLGLRVVAEGIESERAWFLLREWGCDEAQGYLIGKPAPAHLAMDRRLTFRFSADDGERVASAFQ